MLRRLLLAVLLLTTPAAFARHHPPKHHKVKITLFPTAGSLLAQNAEAEQNGLGRFRDKAGIAGAVQADALVAVPTGRALRSTIPTWRAYLRPHAAAELGSISETFYDTFEKPLTVDSAVRPLDVQRRLWRSRRFPAAPPYGPTASVHPVGIAFDIGKRSLTKQQRLWMQWRLFYLQAIGQVIVEEERACYHVVAVLTPYQSTSRSRDTFRSSQAELTLAIRPRSQDNTDQQGLVAASASLRP
ncbi:MAG: DUF5715 family protein [Candidatus Paceibacteria bacterium]